LLVPCELLERRYIGGGTRGRSSGLYMLDAGDRSSDDLAYDGGANVVLARERVARMGGDELAGDDAPETDAERV
jgi:hypothetical protein